MEQETGSFKGKADIGLMGLTAGFRLIKAGQRDNPDKF